MRLLECHDGDFHLKNFPDDQVPPYAILSHTWLRAEEGQGEEPSYEDVTNGTAKKKAGYEKIQFCGERARQDGLEHFWVDTCCINKDNKAELQHAINSMFRWYRNSTRCYVYLSDMSAKKRKASNHSSDFHWESAFRASRWFTRGWTLQELLAPRSVEFFSRESTRLGDKGSLEHHIHQITGVSKLALRGARLSQFKDEPFSWIQSRETKCEEDKAYSLLGIFGVQIPLRYGEGIARANERLDEKIAQHRKCLQDLHLTDPSDDKKRIEDTKGGLFEGSYRWIIESSEFRQLCSAQQSLLLWVKGDPGKGKTMLLCGIINELSKSTTVDTALLSYFFCQATDSRINNAIAVLRGLMYMLVSQQPSLVLYIQKKYDHVGSGLFEGPNAWIALSEIFTNILRDPELETAYLMIDALDECVTDLPKLLDFVTQTLSISHVVKWIVSSRNWPSIERNLDTVTQKLRLCLELNDNSISAAITAFIQFKIDKLAKRNRYNNNIQDAVQQYLTQNANGTFLWVALVCQELSDISGWRVQKKLTAFPPGLDALYQRMLDQIRNSEDAEVAELCRRILAIVSTVSRPITLDELVALADMPNEVASDFEALSEVIGLCGSFLTLREHTLFFIHQSAKEFLIKRASKEIFLSGMEFEHLNILSRTLKVMSRTLRRDICSLHAPGCSTDQIKPPNPDPLAAARYSCLYWVQHLQRSGSQAHDGDEVHRFLQAHLLHWLEALGWMGKTSEAIQAILSLEAHVLVNESPDLHAFIYDAKRFALYNRPLIEKHPLQLYCSALVFAPESSIVRKKFEGCIPDWIQSKPKAQLHWNLLQQTLEGHTQPVSSVAFSPDGSRVVSGSHDRTVRLWDAATGALQQTLEGHTGSVWSVAFSPDGSRVVSGSHDRTVRLWDAATGALQQTLEGHTDSVWSVAFSPDGSRVVSGSHDRTVRLWDAATGALQQTLEGHTQPVSSVAFSPDGSRVVSGSWDRTVRLWDAATGALQQTLEGHTDSVWSVAFSPDGSRVVSGSHDRTVRLWDAATGALQQTLEGHTQPVTSVAFSPDGSRVVSGSHDRTVRLWDAATGALQQTLEGHTQPVTSVAFSPDGSRVVSGSHDRTVRLWDAATGALQQTLEGHTQPVTSVAFSPDGSRVVSGSWDRTVRLWDAATGALQQTLEGHTDSVWSVAFSPDGSRVVSGSHDRTVRLWDAATGALQQTLEGHTQPVSSVAFLPNGSRVVSGSYDRTVRLWDAATGALQQTLEGHTQPVTSVAFSPDGSRVVSGSWDRIVRLWDAATGALQQTLEGHTDSVWSVAFSPDGSRVVSGSYDRTVRLWDAATGALQQTLEGHTGSVWSVAFSPDGKLLPNLYVSNHWVVEGDTDILWLPPDYRPTCSATCDKKLVIGRSSGGISFFCIGNRARLVK